MSKRKADVNPPREAWRFVYASTKVAKGWEVLKSQLKENCQRAYEQIVFNPRPQPQTNRHERLRGKLSTKSIDGQNLEQWQYEVGSGARIWYAIDDDNHLLIMTHAAVEHPKKTDKKNFR